MSQQGEQLLQGYCGWPPVLYEKSSKCGKRSLLTGLLGTITILYPELRVKIHKLNTDNDIANSIKKPTKHLVEYSHKDS